MKSGLFFLFSFFITLCSCPFLKKIAFRYNILDLPGGRKVHKAPTPLLGGVAIYLGLLLGFLLNWRHLHFLWPVLAAGTLILVVGAINDMRELSVQLRLIFQVLAGLIVIANGIRISFLPNAPWGDIIEIIVTLLWIVGLTNAYNYLDGLDGLAAGSAIVNLSCFTVILYMTGQYSVGLLAMMLAASCAGFLPYNFNNNKIFLGEAGSTFLGFTLACIALVGYWATSNFVKISIPVLILGVPIFDMIFTTILRIKEGKVKTILEWLKYGGKDHFHHYLMDLGLTQRGAVIFIYFVTFSLGISAIMVSNDRNFEAILTLSQSAIIFGIIATLIVVGKRRHLNGNEGQ